MRFVETSIAIAQPTEIVLNAFNDPRDLKAWWGVERSLIELRKGGIYSLVWQKSEAALDFVLSGIIAEFIPGSRLKIDHMIYLNPQRPVFGPMELLVETREDKIGTALTIVQSGYQTGEHWDWYYDIVKETWPMVGLKIKEYLENKID